MSQGHRSARFGIYKRRFAQRSISLGTRSLPASFQLPSQHRACHTVPGRSLVSTRSVPYRNQARTLTPCSARQCTFSMIHVPLHAALHVARHRAGTHQYPQVPFCGLHRATRYMISTWFVPGQYPQAPLQTIRHFTQYPVNRHATINRRSCTLSLRSARQYVGTHRCRVCCTPQHLTRYPVSTHQRPGTTAHNSAYTVSARLVPGPLPAGQ